MKCFSSQSYRILWVYCLVESSFYVRTTVSPTNNLAGNAHLSNGCSERFDTWNSFHTHFFLFILKVRNTLVFSEEGKKDG